MPAHAESIARGPTLHLEVTKHRAPRDAQTFGDLGDTQRLDIDQPQSLHPARGVGVPAALPGVLELAAWERAGEARGREVAPGVVPVDVLGERVGPRPSADGALRRAW